MKIAVLGSGMVGSAIAMDLASRHHVAAFDVSEANLELLKKRNPRIETQQAAVNLLTQNLFNEKEVFPPELVGKHKSCFDFIIEYLKERKVNWVKKEF